MQTPSRLKVVCLGGGTGLSALLSGFRHLSLHSPFRIRGHSLVLKNITGIVTVADDGGSSGRIRSQFQTPAPGDIRNCLLALASDQTLMAKLFSYRFQGQGELHNHSLGNLLLTALTDISGDFLQAIRLSSHILAVEGQILPSTRANVQLKARFSDDTEVVGESRISRSHCPIERVSLLPPNCPPLPESLQAIAEADLIVAGPGSLFTSLIPNLLVEGMAEAMERSKAMKVYVGNLMTEPGETLGLTASQHLSALTAHAGGRQLFRHVVFNSEPLPADVTERYRQEGAQPVRVDREELARHQVMIHQRPMLEVDLVARHHPVKLARTILEIYEKEGSHAR